MSQAFADVVLGVLRPHMPLVLGHLVVRYAQTYQVYVFGEQCPSWIDTATGQLQPGKPISDKMSRFERLLHEFRREPVKAFCRATLRLVVFTRDLRGPPTMKLFDVRRDLQMQFRWPGRNILHLKGYQNLEQLCVWTENSTSTTLWMAWPRQRHVKFVHVTIPSGASSSDMIDNTGVVLIRTGKGGVRPWHLFEQRWISPTSIRSLYAPYYVQLTGDRRLLVLLRGNFVTLFPLARADGPSVEYRLPETLSPRSNVWLRFLLADMDTHLMVSNALEYLWYRLVPPEQHPQHTFDLQLVHRQLFTGKNRDVALAAPWEE